MWTSNQGNQGKSGEIREKCPRVKSQSVYDNVDLLEYKTVSNENRNVSRTNPTVLTRHAPYWDRIGEIERQK